MVIARLGRTLAGFGAHRIAAAGAARTFQTPMSPKGLIAAEAVSSARYRTDPTTVLGGMLTLRGTRRAILRDRKIAIELLSVKGIVERNVAMVYPHRPSAAACPGRR